MYVTGAIASADNVTILTIFANTDVNLSLFTGGLLAVGTSFIFHIRQGQPRVKSMKVVWEGLKTMIPAISILLMACMIGSMIGTIKTGEYLAQLVHDAS